MSGPLLAVDAPSLLYRAFFALPDSITDDEKRPVNALLGSANLILAEAAAHSPRAVCLCFGAEAAAYRTELLGSYHADRPEMPEGLASQWERSEAFYSGFGWHVLRHPTLEADDLLGTLADLETTAGGEALLLTGDRDMFQCASDSVRVLYVSTGTRGGTAMGPDEVRAKYGIDPEQVPDFIALRGDPSDGIPGAKGVGEKTAAELLRTHGSLEAILEGAIRERRPKLRTTLIEMADELREFKRIATLQDAELDLPADAPTDDSRAAATAREFGMNRLADRLESGSWREG
ncbi:5'-3' exonuclease [Thermoleophilia bacterium SCSIO 60948]|nr:5'-3' exonuclease [Thermoleophilia bacterium SCSIO 60948]